MNRFTKAISAGATYGRITVLAIGLVGTVILLVGVLAVGVSYATSGSGHLTLIDRVAAAANLYAEPDVYRHVVDAHSHLNIAVQGAKSDRAAAYHVRSAAQHLREAEKTTKIPAVAERIERNPRHP